MRKQDRGRGEDDEEQPPSRRKWSFYPALIILVLPIWGIVPLSWVYLCYSFVRRYFLGDPIGNWPLFIWASFEVSLLDDALFRGPLRLPSTLRQRSASTTDTSRASWTALRLLQTQIWTKFDESSNASWNSAFGSGSMEVPALPVRKRPDPAQLSTRRS